MSSYKIILIVILVLAFTGCSGEGDRKSEVAVDEIVQKQDGLIFLSLKDAYLLHDINDPYTNTAEWSFEVINKGRYEVWLSSYTKDTMNLCYDVPVIVHFGDKRIESQPVGNEIVLNDDHVIKPYFRADSRLGSILIEDTGHYNLQIVSEKVLPPMTGTLDNSANTIIDQIILKPQSY